MLRDEARAVFPRTVIPRDFDTIEIPFAERGRPELVRWDPDAAAATGAAEPPNSVDAEPAAAEPPNWSTPSPRPPSPRREGPGSRGLRAGSLRYERLGTHHAAELEALMLDPRVWRTLQDPGEPPPTAPDILRNIERKHAHWEIHGSASGWCVTAPTAWRSAAAGCNTPRSPARARSRSAGGAARRWGRGFATELALTSIEAAFESLGLAEVIAYTQPDNLASRRVMEKAGMVYQGELIHEDLPHVLYRLQAP